MTSSNYDYDDYHGNGGDVDLKPINFIGSNGAAVDFEQVVAESEARIAATIAAGAEVVITAEDLAKVEEIRWLHDTAIKRALARDGHSKSGEGLISLSFGTYWGRLDDDGNPTVKQDVEVSIYAYVIGTNRSHNFATIDRALETVRVWYANEMSRPEKYDIWEGAEEGETEGYSG